MNVLKLVKLIYLADRRYMQKFDETMLGDKFVSMTHGPVNSLTYACMCEGREGWDDFIGDRVGNSLLLAHPSTEVADLDELSDADIETLNETWKEFGQFSQWELVDYTHKYCPEWEDPGETSTPIPYSRVFKFLGKDNSERLANRVFERQSIDRALNRVKCLT